jgi:hypothetical protein
MEVEQLQVTSFVGKKPYPFKFENETIHCDLALPPQSLPAITIEFEHSPRAKDDHA